MRVVGATLTNQFFFSAHWSDFVGLLGTEKLKNYTFS